MTDIQIAKNNLAEHTICLCKDGACLYGDSRGISSIMSFIESIDLSGYAVADKVVGKAAALLFVRCGIAEVFAKTLSESAKKVLESNGVRYEYEVLTEKIINRAGTDMCPMEKTVIDTDDPDMAYMLLKNKLKSLAAN